MSAPTLRTDRLVLRRPDARDWPAWRDFMQSDRSAAISDTRDIGRIWRAFAAEIGHWDIFGYGMWAVARDDDAPALALVGPWTPPDWPEAEIGWMVLDPAAEGTGFAAEAARAAIGHAYGTLGWDTIVSYIAPGNDRSIALAERLGARLDPDARGPKDDTLVYRHPRPEARA